MAFEELDTQTGPRSYQPTIDATEASGAARSSDDDESIEDTMVAVEPMREDEFTCSRCFLVWHRRRQASHRVDERLCQDCA